MNIHELPTLKIDLKDNYVVEAVCKQLDDLILSFEIYNSYIPIDLSSFYIELRALKSDKVPVIQDTDIVITNNKLKIKCNPQLTTSSGVVKAELECIDKITKEKKFSFDIEIEVKPSVLEVNRSISTPTCTLMERLEKDLDKVRDLEFNFNEANKINKELKDTTIPNANKINTTLEENTKKATTSNTNLKDSTNTANTAKQAVDSSVVQANASKQALDTSKVNADNTKKEVDNSIKIADEKIEIIKNLDPENVVGDVKKLKEQVLESTYTKIETDSTLTKLESCKDSFVHNMQIRGKTFQNLSGSKDRLNKEDRIFWDDKYLDLIKPNTKYTFLFNVVTNTVTGSTGNNIGKTGNTVDSVNSKSIVPKLYQIPRGFTGVLAKEAFISPSSIDKSIYNCITRPEIYSDVTGGELKFESMVLEGDWTNKEIPSYFEGIKSVGEAEGNKISILSCGKNLIPPFDKWTLAGNIKLTGNNELTQIQTAPYSDKATSPKFLINSSKAYRLTGTSGLTTYLYQLQLQEYDKNLNKIGGIRYIDKYEISSFNTNTKYIQLSINSGASVSGTIIFKDWQLEEGTTTTTYEPYKEDKTEILLSSPHMGIGDVQDIVDFDKNERIKNIAKDIWNGNEDWTVNSSIDNEIVFQSLFSKSKTTSSSKGEVIFNKNLKVIAFTETNIFARIDKSQLSTPDVAGFKKLLKTWADAGTPLEVCYQLAEPKTEKLNIKDTLQTFQDGYIMLDNTITPCTQLEYSTNIPSALGGLTKVVDKLVDDVTNVEITISDMDAEIDEARKGKATLEERLEEDRTNILKTIGNVNVETDGDIASQLKNNKNNIEKAVQKLISINDANIDTIFENGIYRCYKPQSGFPAGYTKDSDFFLINYNTNDKDTKPWARQTLYDIRSNRVFIRSIRGGVISPWQELATVDDTDWIDLPLLNGATTTSDKALYRRIGKMVYFKGVVNNITTDNFIFGNLPIGFRPNSKSGGANIPVSLFLSGEDIPSRLSVYQNGNLLLAKKNDRNTCYLDGVMFVLD